MEPTIGMVVEFGGNFAPRDWMLCDGQQLEIARNSALFSVIGTIYGGDGRRYFKLPDLRGRAALGYGTLPGNPPVNQGEILGKQHYQYNYQTFARHIHAAHGDLKVKTSNPDSSTPMDSYPAPATLQGASGNVYHLDHTYNGITNICAIDVDNTGHGQPVNNMQPWLCVNHIICVSGAFPVRP